MTSVWLFWHRKTAAVKKRFLVNTFFNVCEWIFVSWQKNELKWNFVVSHDYEETRKSLNRKFSYGRNFQIVFLKKVTISCFFTTTWMKPRWKRNNGWIFSRNDKRFVQGKYIFIFIIVFLLIYFNNILYSFYTK